MRFLISVPEATHSALKRHSKRMGYTLTGLIREILWDWLKEHEERKEQPE